MTYDTECWIWFVLMGKVARLVAQIKAALSANQVPRGEVWSLLWQIMHYCLQIPARIFNLNYLNSVTIDHKFNVDRGQELKQ